MSDAMVNLAHVMTIQEVRHPYPTLSYLILPFLLHSIILYLILLNPILAYPTRSYHTLSYPILAYLIHHEECILSYPIILYPRMDARSTFIQLCYLIGQFTSIPIRTN